jgi:octaprenyl-diphosphate synthase
LIYLLENSTFIEKRRIINIIKNHNRDVVKVAEIIQKVNQSGGIAYTRQKMAEYRQAALDILHQFPESPSLQAMEQLVLYTTERKK